MIDSWDDKHGFSIVRSHFRQILIGIPEYAPRWKGAVRGEADV